MSERVRELNEWHRRCIEAATDMGLAPPSTRLEVLTQDALAVYLAKAGMEVRYAHWSIAQAAVMLRQQPLGGVGLSDYLTNTDPVVIPVALSDPLPRQYLTVAFGVLRAHFLRINEHCSRGRPDLIQIQMRDHASEIARFRADEEIGRARVSDALSAAHGLRLVRTFPEGVRSTSLLAHLAENAPDLPDWKRRILQIVDSETAHFSPQIATRVLCAGWGAYWAPQLIDVVLGDGELDLRDSLHIAYARAVERYPSYRAGERFNAFMIGSRMLERVMGRWREAETATHKPLWYREEFSPREALFDIARRGYDSVTLRAWLDEETVRSLGLIREVTFPIGGEFELYGNLIEIPARKPIALDIADTIGWEAVRDIFLLRVGFGLWPSIRVVRGAHSEYADALFLRHVWDDGELDSDEAKATIVYAQQFWKSGVVLETRKIEKDDAFLYICNRHGIVKSELDAPMQSNFFGV